MWVCALFYIINAEKRTSKKGAAVVVAAAAATSTLSLMMVTIVSVVTMMMMRVGCGYKPTYTHTREKTSNSRKTPVLSIFSLSPSLSVSYFFLFTSFCSIKLYKHKNKEYYKRYFHLDTRHPSHFNKWRRENMYIVIN